MECFFSLHDDVSPDVLHVLSALDEDVVVPVARRLVQVIVAEGKQNLLQQGPEIRRLDHCGGTGLER